MSAACSSVRVSPCLARQIALNSASDCFEMGIDGRSMAASSPGRRSRRRGAEVATVRPSVDDAASYFRGAIALRIRPSSSQR